MSGRHVGRRDAAAGGLAVLIMGMSAVAASAETNPDADLIRTCAEHIANRDAYNARAGEVLTEQDPRWHAYARTLDAISDARPQTLAGLVAKAKATKAEATRPDGAVEPEDAADWAWDLVEDLIRLRESV